MTDRVGKRTGRGAERKPKQRARVMERRRRERVLRAAEHPQVRVELVAGGRQ